MREIKIPSVIRELIRAKQALEVRLAYELLEVFNSEDAGFIKRLRQMVLVSVDIMDDLAMGEKTKEDFKKKWSTDWIKYAVCTDNGLIRDWSPGQVKFKSSNFIAQHCADWIRIFGEAIEDVAKGSEDSLRKSFQKGDPYHWKKYDAKKPGDQLDAGRRRVTEEQMQKGNVPVLTDYSAAEFMVWGFMRDISKGNLPEKQNPTGINRWRVMEKDAMGKMDQVFGLMPGATISGTTTDNIYFFEKFRGLGLDPVFYMLPLATIVGGGHHSLLEVGLPLSSNGKGAYKVGLYSTLFPTGCQDQNRPAGVYEIENILRFAEGHPDNHLMLIYYDRSQQPAGCYLYENNDKGKWQRMCTGDDLLRVFRGVQAWPNRDQIILLKPALGIF